MGGQSRDERRKTRVESRGSRVESSFVRAANSTQAGVPQARWAQPRREFIRAHSHACLIRAKDIALLPRTRVERRQSFVPETKPPWRQDCRALKDFLWAPRLRPRNEQAREDSPGLSWSTASCHSFTLSRQLFGALIIMRHAHPAADLVRVLAVQLLALEVAHGLVGLLLLVLLLLVRF